MALQTGQTVTMKSGSTPTAASPGGSAYGALRTSNQAKVLGTRQVGGKTYVNLDFRPWGGGTGWAPLTSGVVPTSQAKKKAPTSKWVDPNLASKKIIETTYQKQMRLLRSAITKWEEENPFAIDEAWEARAAETAGELLDPLYERNRADFLEGIETRRRRGVEDERAVLDELRSDVESFTGRTRRELDRALNASAEGFAESGMFFSGRRTREAGLLEAESGIERGEFLGKAGRREAEVKRLTGRELEDISRERRLGTRGLLEEHEIEKERKVGEFRQRDIARRQGEFEQVIGPQIPNVQSQDIFNLAMKRIGSGY